MAQTGPDPEKSFQETQVLIAAYQGGDQAALEQLITRYYPRVNRIIRARMGSLLRAHLDPDDAVQQVFIRIVRDLDRFSIQDDALFINWVATLAERELANLARGLVAQKRDVRKELPMQKLTPANLERSMSFEPRGKGPGPSTVAEGRELEERLDECIHKLREDFREVILLRNHAGGSWEWVAEQLGSPSAEAARKLHTRAMIDLRDLVSGAQ